MENPWLASTLWMALALLASLVSIRLAISVALIEIVVGSLGGNLMGLTATPWVDYLAVFWLPATTRWVGRGSRPR